MAQHTRNRKVFCLVLLSAAVDACVSTLLFSHVSEFTENLTAEAKFYEFSSSVFEFWLFSLIRTSILLGFLFGVYKNGTTEGLDRLQCVHIPVLFVVIFFWVFGIIKMLVYTEKLKSFSSESSIWFWAQFAWFEFASLWSYVSYVVLKTSGISEVTDVDASREDAINSVDEERQKLLDSSEENTEHQAKPEEKKTVKQKASSVMRLMFYSRPDIPYLIIAFIFMILSSLGKCVFTLLSKVSSVCVC